MVTLVPPPTEVVVACRHRGCVDEVVRHGHTKGGNQRYRCLACKHTFCLNPGTTAHSEEFKKQVYAASQERAWMRGVCRIFGISRNTLSAWLKKKALELPPLSSTLAAARRGDKLEMDELWSFVLHKGNQRWVWLVLCRRTRQVLAAAIGGRDAATCQRLWSRIPEGYRKKYIYTDFYETYFAVLPEKQHRPSAKGSGETNHIERFNNTLRQRLSRFVRKTLWFSKSSRMHWFCLLLFLHDYNRCCVKRFKLA